MPNKGKSGHSGLPIALISRLPDWVVQSVLPIAIHRLLHRLYPLASIYTGEALLHALHGPLYLFGPFAQLLIFDHLKACLIVARPLFYFVLRARARRRNTHVKSMCPESLAFM